MENKLLGLAIVVSLLVLFGCSSTADTVTTNEVPDDFDRLDFERTASFYDEQSGWNYSLMIHYPDKKKDEIDSISLDGINLKYAKLDGFSTVNVLDEEGNVVDTADRVMPSLIASDMYDKEITEIHDFLTDKKFNHTISENDLKDLNITVISKKQLVDLYNEAIVLPTRRLGKFMAAPYANCAQSKLDNDDIVQVSYESNYGDMGKINIEYIYSSDDGSHLSDRVLNGTASEEEVLFQREIDNLEKQIESTQKYEVDINIEITDDFDVQLKNLLFSMFNSPKAV